MTEITNTGAFDYVVIGGGTAGLAVAARLAESENVSICVLEAGEDVTNTPEASIPGLASQLWTKETNWGFTSIGQKHLDGKVIDVHRGKGLGGSSTINLMQLNRAPAREYDALERIGNKGWNAAELLKYFIKSQSLAYTPAEIASLRLEIDEKEFGTGPIINTISRYMPTFHNQWFKVFEEFGVPYNTKAVGGETIGTWAASLSVHPDTVTRISSATAYYEPNKHKKNLTVLTGAHVTRIQLNTTSTTKPTAEGVEYEKAGKRYSVSARKEIVLSAGTVQTPQILELSGIGQKKILDKCGIPTIVDLPGVGENYRILTVYELKPGHESYDIIRMDPNRAAEETKKFAEKQEGMLTTAPGLYAFLPLEKLEKAQNLRDTVTNTKWDKIPESVRKIQQEWLSDPNVPQVELLTFPFFYPTLHQPLPDPGKQYLCISIILLHCFSRGSIHINSPNPLSKPEIDLSALDNAFDSQAILGALNLARKVVSTTDGAFSEVIAKEVAPGDVYNDKLEEYIKSGLVTAFHPVGTAPMMKREEGGVVDERLRVYGVDRLRIADASILPMQLGAHAQATVYAIAEKVADMIKEDA